MTGANPTSERTLGVGLLLALVVLTGVRLWLIQPSAAIGGFGHDSAYIARLADNILVGNGYVNHALWLVFLQPDGLPMPFHNANPLYPELIARVSSLTGVSVLAAGYAINIVAHSLLLVALVLLLQPWMESLFLRGVLAAGAGFFPAVFIDSMAYLPDLLCLTFVVFGLTCMVRGQAWWAALLVGACFGLAWLARSSASVALPLFVVYLIGKFGWRGLGRCVLLGLAAAVVASPWMWHTHQVWGSPFRSDSAYYLLQNYHARGQGYDAEYFWHSPEKPPSLGEVVSREPAEFFGFIGKSLPLVAYNALGGWAEGNRYVGLWLAALVLAALAQMALAYRRSKERPAWVLPALAVGLYALAALVAFAPRARSLEIRYFAPLSLALALLLMLGLIHAIRRRNWLLIVLGLAFWLGWVPWQDVRKAEILRAEVPDRVAYFEQARVLQLAVASGNPVVVGSHPYFYNLATGDLALSIPYSDDVYLLNYMKHYQARFVVLTPGEVEFWRPGWKSSPPEGLKWREDLSSETLRVYELAGPSS